MEIREVENKEIWERFVSSHTPNTFLQSWGWGEYQHLSGNKIFRLGLFDQDQLVGVCLVSLIQARKGPLLYCQHGPLIDWKKKPQFDAILAELIKIGKRERAWFIRLTPLIEDKSCNDAIIKSLAFDKAFVKAPVHNVDAQITLILDLRQDECTLLKNMRKSTRYEVKRAQKAGVKVFKKTDREGLDQFYSLYTRMQKRQEFIPYPYERFENEFKALKSVNQQEIFFAKYHGEITSAAIINYYSQTAFYNHGASVLKRKDVPTSHLLQWEIIRYAKNIGYHFYNLWGGIAPHQNHPWWGITVFKKGFGGKQVNYIHAQDLPLSKKYYLAYAIEKLKKMKRGL